MITLRSLVNSFHQRLTVPIWPVLFSRNCCLITKGSYVVYKYTFRQIHHITTIRSNTHIRHCSKCFLLNNPSVTCDLQSLHPISISSLQAKCLPRLRSQTDSAHSPCNSAVNHSGAYFSNFENSQKIKEKSYDHNFFTNVISTKRIFSLAKKKFRG